MRPRRAPRPRLPLWTGKPDLVRGHPGAQKESEFRSRSRGFWTAGSLRVGIQHFPTGEKRDASTGAKLKRMGTKPGWPDLILVSPSGEFPRARTQAAGRGPLRRAGGVP
jgi:hypothetical protein